MADVGLRAVPRRRDGVESPGLALPVRWSPVPVAFLAAVFTALVVLVRPFDVAYRSWTLHVAIETVAGVVCLVAAYLFAGRYLLGRKLSDLLLACALLILAIGGILFSLLPAALAGGSVTRFSTWAPVFGDVLGACGFAAAAFVTAERRLSRRALAAVAAGFVAVVLLIALLIGEEGSRLPVAISPGLSPVEGGRRLFVGSPGILALQVVSVGLFAAASVGFWRRRRRDGDELIGMLAVASCLGAFSSFNYVLFPSLYSQWVYAGDILRMAFYVTLLAGVAREVNSYWQGRAAAAALEERRRIARELHDGLAQELAFMATQSKLLEGELARDLSSAAERALEESRRAIDALTRPLDESLDVAVQRAAEEVAIRFGVALTVELQEGLDAAADVRDAFRRIAREAAINAARHGGASRLLVTLADDRGRLLLRIEDDGAGFDPDGATRGFGLVSMRERAANVGGELRVHSWRGAGTAVEVSVP